MGALCSTFAAGWCTVFSFGWAELDCNCFSISPVVRCPLCQPRVLLYRVATLERVTHSSRFKKLPLALRPLGFVTELMQSAVFVFS